MDAHKRSLVFGFLLFFLIYDCSLTLAAATTDLYDDNTVAAANLPVLEQVRRFANSPRRVSGHERGEATSTSIQSDAELDADQVLRAIGTGQPALLLGLRQVAQWNALNAWDSSNAEYMMQRLAGGRGRETTLRGIFASNESVIWLHREGVIYNFPGIPRHYTVETMQSGDLFREISESQRQQQQQQQRARYFYFAQMIQENRFLEPLLSDLEPRDFMDIVAQRAKSTHHAGGWQIWLGSAGVSTQLHFDLDMNLHVQINGNKTFYLFPPEFGARAYLSPRFHPGYRRSQVPLGSSTCSEVVTNWPNAGRFFGCSKASTVTVESLSSDDEVGGSDNLAAAGEFAALASSHEPPSDIDQYSGNGQRQPVVVTLQAGQALYIPPLWFHHVVNENAGISANLWLRAPGIKNAWEASTKLLPNVSSGTLALRAHATRLYIVCFLDALRRKLRILGLPDTETGDAFVENHGSRADDRFIRSTQWLITTKPSQTAHVLDDFIHAHWRQRFAPSVWHTLVSSDISSDLATRADTLREQCDSLRQAGPKSFPGTIAGAQRAVDKLLPGIIGEGHALVTPEDRAARLYMLLSDFADLAALRSSGKEHAEAVLVLRECWCPECRELDDDRLGS